MGQALPPAFRALGGIRRANCIRPRKRTVANEEEGCYSAMPCFMANQACQKKARILWDSKRDLPA